MDNVTSTNRFDEADEVESVPLSGTRAQMIQRLQVGLFGLGAMVMMIGLADIVMERMKETEASSVPEAAPTVAVEKKVAAPSDPLAEAGVLPEIPVAPTPSPTPGERALDPDDSADMPPHEPKP